MTRALAIPTAMLAVALATGLPARADAPASPTNDRVFAAPTAWLAPENAIVATGVLDLREATEFRPEGALIFGYGIGGLGQLDVGVDTDLRGRVGDGPAENLAVGRAAYRMGVPQGTWSRYLPAMLVGLRTSFASGGDFDGLEVVDAYAVASAVLGPVRLHGGISLLDARFEDGDTVVEGKLVARPSGGIEWTPPQYPKSSFMVDFTYLPLVERDDSGGRITTEWLVGWGARYQAFDWGAIELAVRHREGEGIGDSTAFVRLHGVFRPFDR